ncbi:hypothetical protein D3C71_1127160 [compost metagenome]
MILPVRSVICSVEGKVVQMSQRKRNAASAVIVPVKSVAKNPAFAVVCRPVVVPPQVVVAGGLTQVSVSAVG